MLSTPEPGKSYNKENLRSLTDMVDWVAYLSQRKQTEIEYEIIYKSHKYNSCAVYFDKFYVTTCNTLCSLDCLFNEAK